MSSTPTKEATQAAFKVKHGALNGNRYAYEFNLELAAEIIDRELKYPALLESHKQLQEAAVEAIHAQSELLAMLTLGLDWKDAAKACSESIARLTKAKEITP